jgi:PIF1 helicase.
VQTENSDRNAVRVIDEIAGRYVSNNEAVWRFFSFSMHEYNLAVVNLAIHLENGELIEKVFPNIRLNYRNHDWLSEGAILAAKNKDVYQLNNVTQSSIQSEEITYKSIDTVVEADEPLKWPLPKLLNVPTVAI